MKKFNYKKIATALLWILAVSGIGISLAFVSESTGLVRASSLDITIENNDENFFIDDEEVKDYFASRQDRIIGATLNEISLPNLEKALNAHPAVENAEVAASLNGKVFISVRQRTPILRVFSVKGESYYIDSQSRLMPLDDHYTARVLVATGNINEPYARRSQLSVQQILANETYSKISMLDDLYLVARQLLADSSLAVLIHQMHVNNENEIELFPAAGNHRIILGDASDLHIKFNKLKLFYTEGLNATNAWSKYSVINLKYKDLVVCTRK